MKLKTLHVFDILVKPLDGFGPVWKTNRLLEVANNFSWENLINMLGIMTQPSNFQVFYHDDDDDEVSINGEDEFLEAKKIAGDIGLIHLVIKVPPDEDFKLVDSPMDNSIQQSVWLRLECRVYPGFALDSQSDLCLKKKDPLAYTQIFYHDYDSKMLLRACDDLVLNFNGENFNMSKAADCQFTWKLDGERVVSSQMGRALGVVNVDGHLAVRPLLPTFDVNFLWQVQTLSFDDVTAVLESYSDEGSSWLTNGDSSGDEDLCKRFVKVKIDSTSASLDALDFSSCDGNNEEKQCDLLSDNDEWFGERKITSSCSSSEIQNATMSAPPSWFEDYMNKFRKELCFEMSKRLDRKGEFERSVTNQEVVPFVCDSSAAQAHQVSCDACRMSIFGIRYKCGNCASYDLCEKCEATVPEHNPRHVFLKIKRPIAPVKRKAGRSLLNRTIYPTAEEEQKLYEKTMKQQAKLKRRFERSMMKNRERDQKSKEDKMKRKRMLSELPQLHCQSKGMDAEFLSDASLPDGSIVRPGDRLTKMWNVRNSGPCTWEDVKLKLMWGNISCDLYEVDVPITEPDQEVTLSIQLTASLIPGSYQCHWRLTHNGKRFGHRVWCSFVVEDKVCSSVSSAADVSASVLPLGSIVAVPKICNDFSIPQVMENEEKCEGKENDCVVHVQSRSLSASDSDSENEEVEWSINNFEIVSRQLSADQLGCIKCENVESEDASEDFCHGSNINNDIVVSHDPLELLSTQSSSSVEVVSDNELEEYIVVPMPDCFNTSLPASLVASTSIRVPLRRGQSSHFDTKDEAQADVSDFKEDSETEFGCDEFSDCVEDLGLSSKSVYMQKDELTKTTQVTLKEPTSEEICDAERFGAGINSSSQTTTSSEIASSDIFPASYSLAITSAEAGDLFNASSSPSEMASQILNAAMGTAKEAAASALLTAKGVFNTLQAQGDFDDGGPSGWKQDESQWRSLHSDCHSLIQPWNAFKQEENLPTQECTPKQEWAPPKFEWVPPKLEWVSPKQEWVPTKQEWTPTKLEWTPFKQEWIPTKQEWTPTKQEWTPSKQEWTPSKQEWTPSKQEWTASEQEWTPSKQEWTPSKQEWTPSKQEWIPPKHEWIALQQGWSGCNTKWRSSKDEDQEFQKNGIHMDGSHMESATLMQPRRMKEVPVPSQMERLIEMGFADRSLNQQLLDRFDENIDLVVQELIKDCEEKDWFKKRH